MRQRWIDRTICSVIAFALVVVTSGPVLADTNSVVRSVILPGSGQAQQGHYTKAAVIAGSAVVTGIGLLLSQVHYNQSVIRYNELKEVYAGYPALLEGGTVVSYSSITQTYSDMQEAWDQSENRKSWRNIFLGAFAITYAVNLVDIIRSKPDTGETPKQAALGIQMDSENIRIFKTFDF